MSQFSDYAENKIADFIRGQSITLPTNWRLAALSAWTDSSQTEIVGSGITRITVARSLANFAGTQGAGTTLASNGNSKSTSNNTLLDFGTATGSAGTITHIGFFDATSGGNCWMGIPLTDPIVLSNGVAAQVAIGSLAMVLGANGGATDYLVNKMIDLIFRGQSFTWPVQLYVAALLSGGAEVGGGVGYARVQLTPSLANISGTQGAGTTVASNGSSGEISNNNSLTFPTATANWGDVGRASILDASSGGNTLWMAALAATKTISIGRTLSFSPGTLKIDIA